MAKRFTDTNKWDRAWFRKLSPSMKCAWVYLCDKCDHAGIWTADFESMSFHVGEPITQEMCLTSFADKIRAVGSDKFVLQSFIDFQYGTLNPENRVHQSVISRLQKEGANKDLISPLEGAKDKDKDKDKEKDKEKDTSAAKKFQERFNPENAVFIEKLKELDLKSTQLEGHVFKVRERFGDLASLNEWIEGIAESKGFKDKETPGGKKAYLIGALLNEAGIRGAS